MNRSFSARALLGLSVFGLGIGAGLLEAPAQAPVQPTPQPVAQPSAAPAPPATAPIPAPVAAPAAAPAAVTPTPNPATAPAPVATPASAPAPEKASPADIFAEAVERACNAMQDGRLVGDALGGLAVLGEEIGDLPQKGQPVWALRSMSQAAFVTAGAGSACYVVATPNLADAAAREFLSAIIRRAVSEGAGAAAASAVVAPAMAPAPAAALAPAVQTAAAVGPQFNDFAPGAVATAVQSVCEAGLRAGQSVKDAAAAAGLKAATAPSYALPNYSPGGDIWRVPSNDGEVILFNKPDDPKSCHLVVAHVPVAVADILADRLAAAGMNKGAFGPMGESGRYQQVVAADGKAYANIVAFDGGPATGTPVSIYVQVGVH